MALSSLFCCLRCAFEMGGVGGAGFKLGWTNLPSFKREDSDFANSEISLTRMGGCVSLVHVLREEIHRCMNWCQAGTFVRAIQRHSQFTMMANQAMIPAGTSKVVSKYEDMRSCTLETVTPSIDGGRKHLEMVLNATGKNRQVDNASSSGQCTADGIHLDSRAPTGNFFHNAFRTKSFRFRGIFELQNLIQTSGGCLFWMCVGRTCGLLLQI